MKRAVWLAVAAFAFITSFDYAHAQPRPRVFGLMQARLTAVEQIIERVDQALAALTARVAQGAQATDEQLKAIAVNLEALNAVLEAERALTGEQEAQKARLDALEQQAQTVWATLEALSEQAIDANTAAIEAQSATGPLTALPEQVAAQKARLDALEQQAQTVRATLEALSEQTTAANAAAAEAQSATGPLTALPEQVAAQNANLLALSETIQVDRALMSQQRAQLEALAAQTAALAEARAVEDLEGPPVDPEALTVLEARLETLKTTVIAQEERTADSTSASESQLQALNAAMAEIRDRLSELQAQKVDEQVADLRALLEVIDNQTVSLTAAVSQLRDSDAALGGRLERFPVLEAETAALKGRLDSLASREEDRSEAATPESVDLIDRKIDTLAQTIETLSAAIETDRQSAANQTARLEFEATRITSLIARLEALNGRLNAQFEQSEDHEGRIEDNALKLYEILIEMERSSEQLDEVFLSAMRIQRRGGFNAVGDSEETDAPQATEGLAAVRTGLAFGLTLLAPFGIFLMGAWPERTAEETAEAGSAAALTWAGAAIGFLLLGAGLLLGPSLSGWAGDPSGHFATLVATRLMDLDPATMRLTLGHAALAGLAGLIACSSVGGLRLLQRLLIALIFGALVYPLAAHWLRDAQTALGGAQGWAALQGFLNPGGTAGLAVVSGLGAIFLRRSLIPPVAASPAAASPLGAPSGALILWAAWLGAALITPEPLASPAHTALAAAAGAAGGCVMLTGIGVVFASDGRWLRQLAAAALAGGIAGPGASIGAPLSHCLLIGALAAGLFLALTEARADPDGLTVPACAVAAGGLAAALAPGLVGPVGLIARGTFEALLSQGFGLIALISLSIVAGYVSARVVKSIRMETAP